MKARIHQMYSQKVFHVLGINTYLVQICFDKKSKSKEYL